MRQAISPIQRRTKARRYRTALSEVFQALKARPVSTSTAIAVCGKIKGVELDTSSTPATALMNETTGTVIYPPPNWGKDAT